MADASPRVTLASSTGQDATDAHFLDFRFEACRPAFTAMVGSVGIQPGWHVLDAGCGSGSFLPLLAELVGATGQLAAFLRWSGMPITVSAVHREHVEAFLADLASKFKPATVRNRFTGCQQFRRCGYVPCDSSNGWRQDASYSVQRHDRCGG